jgi:hypothetical protein
MVHSGSTPPGNWFAPPGSNQSSSGGNETAEASGVSASAATTGGHVPSPIECPSGCFDEGTTHSLIEEVAASSHFDESNYNEFYSLLNALEESRGLFLMAADEMTEYYAWWRQNDRHILPGDTEAKEIRENLSFLAEGLRKNVTSFKSFNQLRSLLERKGLEPDLHDGQQS